MAKRRTPQTQAKRQREAAKREKRQSKIERRALRKLQKAEGGGGPPIADAAEIEEDR